MASDVYVNNGVVDKDNSIKYKITGMSGEENILVITEPGGNIDVRIHAVSYDKKWKYDAVSEKDDKSYRYLTAKYDKPYSIELEIINNSKDNATSFAIVLD